MKNRGRYSAKEDLVCFICDFWWLILLVLIIILVLAFKFHGWLSGTGIATVPPSGEIPTSEFLSTPPPLPTPGSTATERDDLSTPESGWSVFRDEKLGYQIEYPKTWFASPLTDSISPAGNAEESVLISNAANNNSPQAHTPDETARMWIVSYEKGQQPLSDWIISNFNWLGGAVNTVQTDGKPALQLDTNLQDNPDLTYYMT